MPEDNARPLAPAADRFSSDDDDTVLQSKKLRQRKYINLCGCVTAVILLLAVAIIVLAFTVFRVKDPIIRLNGVVIEQLDLVNGTTPRPGVNMTLIADVSVKNPNVASFRFSNATTTLYYWGTVVGEARNPPGQTKARRTTRMNVTVEIIPGRILSSPRLPSDIGSGLLTMTSYTKIGGKVKILKIITKHVTVRMNCTMTANITSQELQEQKCTRRVTL